MVDVTSNGPDRTDKHIRSNVSVVLNEDGISRHVSHLQNSTANFDKQIEVISSDEEIMRETDVVSEENIPLRRSLRTQEACEI